MPPKRKNDHSLGESAREKKKQKVAFARTIAVQDSNPGVAAASKDTPSTVDVEKFTEARLFEINAMQQAMENASESSTQRAWQQLPRHLRRRAASHDVRRVPLRLRDKARAEMDTVKKKAIGRKFSKRGKNKQVSRTETLSRRQIDKIWLETHIWHAKRMIMKNQWGYMLAETPTEKAFRPSYRAAVHGSILHDASYQSLIELKGQEQTLERLFKLCCDPQTALPGARRYTGGSRVLDTHIYAPLAFPYGLIAPVTVMWMPLPTSVVLPVPASTEIGSSKKRKKKRKGKVSEINPVPQNGQIEVIIRTVWLRAHPSAFEEIFSTLQESALLVIEEKKKVDPDTNVEIEIADLHGKLNTFDIMGPKASQVLKGALSPVAEGRKNFKEFWSAMTDLETSRIVPRGMVVGFKVYDPRLRFPPKNAKPRDVDLLDAAAFHPTTDLARSDLWQETIREELKAPRFKKKDLDQRRQKNLIPGVHLSPTTEDNIVPVILIQRSLESTISSSDTQGLHGWTLLVPAGWSMPFFTSLTFTGTRVGGQRERRFQSFEAGIPHFPRDYPFTSSYADFDAEHEAEERESWERKPPAKRPNYEKLGRTSPWKADWRGVLGLPGVSNEEETVGDEHQTGDEMVVDAPDASGVRPWLFSFSGPGVTNALIEVNKERNWATRLLAEINKLRTSRELPALDAKITAENFLQGALVQVKLTVYGRGTPKDLAAIYAVNDEDVKSWMLLSKTKSSVVDIDSEQSETNRSLASLVGFVTSGNFSLSRGRGFCIGAISVQRYFELVEQSQRLSPSLHNPSASYLVKFLNRADTVPHLGHVSLLDRKREVSSD